MQSMSENPHQINPEPWVTSSVWQSDTRLLCPSPNEMWFHLSPQKSISKPPGRRPPSDECACMGEVYWHTHSCGCCAQINLCSQWRSSWWLCWSDEAWELPTNIVMVTKFLDHMHMKWHWPRPQNSPTVEIPPCNAEDGMCCGLLRAGLETAMHITCGGWRRTTVSWNWWAGSGRAPFDRSPPLRKQ